MKNRVLLMLLCAVALTACNPPYESIQLTGTTESKVLVVNSFSKLSVSGAIEVIISDTITEARLETDAALIERLRVVQSGKSLTIGYPNGLYWIGESVHRVWIPAEKAELSEIHISGASVIHAALHTRSAQIHLSGSSQAFIEGEAEILKLYLSGASALYSEKAEGQYQLHVTNVYGTISGASMAYLHSDGWIEAELSGASVLYYTGIADTHSSSCSDVSMILHESK